MLTLQVTMRPAPLEGVKRMNTVVVRKQGQRMRMLRRDSYTMEVDKERNCYICGEFRHMARHCGNRKQKDSAVEGKQLEYGGRQEGNYKHLDNLKGMENLESLN